MEGEPKVNPSPWRAQASGIGATEAAQCHVECGGARGASPCVKRERRKLRTPPVLGKAIASPPPSLGAKRQKGPKRRQRDASAGSVFQVRDYVIESACAREYPTYSCSGRTTYAVHEAQERLPPLLQHSGAVAARTLSTRRHITVVGLVKRWTVRPVLSLAPIN